MTVFYEDLKEALTHAKKEYSKNCTYIESNNLYFKYDLPKSLHVKHLVEVKKGKVIARRWAVLFSNTDEILSDCRTFLLSVGPKEAFEDLGFLEATVLCGWLAEWNDWEDEDGYYHNQWELPAEKKNYIDL
jgi:hypothetical protein